MEMYTEFIIRLVVASLMGVIIGLEREYRSKEAGYRTHFLVALGSALMMIVSQYGFSDVLETDLVRLDPSRIASQVVSGIGFIGAGTIILLRKQIVRGLTTAAGIWATSGIGLAIGAGMYVMGITGTVLFLIGVEVLNYFFIACRINTETVITVYYPPAKRVYLKIPEGIGPFDMTPGNQNQSYSGFLPITSKITITNR